MVGAELARAQERERYLEQELRTRRQQPPAPALPTELDDETVARLLGEETTRIVQAARESAAAIKTRAEETAERLVRDAREESQRLREDAELEATRRRKDADTDAEAELEMAKQQGREMVEEARAYRERALAELARRRDLARQQIDQLVHARDRLVQAFERARLAAADVVAELAPLGELDEYVNLAPTTGPVPVMVPASKLAERSSVSDETIAFRQRFEPVTPKSTGAPATTVAADDAVEPDADPPTDPTPTDEVAEVITATGATGESVEPEATSASDGESDIEAPVATIEANTVEVNETDDTIELAQPETSDEPDDDGALDAEPATPKVVESVGRNATVLQFPTIAPPVERRDEQDADDAGDGTDDVADADDLETESGAEAASDLPDAPGDALADDAVADSAVTLDGDEIDDDDVTASDVDDLFARLRAQRVPEPETTPDGEAQAALDGGPADSSPFERRDEVLTPLIVACGRKLKRVLADEQNAALDTLRRKDPVTAIDQLVTGEDEHLAHYVDAISGDVLAAARAGSELVGSAVDDETLRGDALGAVRDAVCGDLVRPLRERLAARIAAGEGDNEAITKSARAIYREWKTKHIDDHLDDLLRVAYNRGAFAALADGTLCRWVADPAVGPCSECEDNSLQGLVPLGMPFPTGHVTAPAHSGCRCLIQPADH